MPVLFAFGDQYYMLLLVMDQLKSTEPSLFPATAQDLYRHKYFTTLYGVLVGLSDQFEPDKTSEHLMKVEQFLIGEEESVEYIKEHYDEEVDGPRLVRHRDMLTGRARCQGTQLEDTQRVVDFLIKDEMFRSMITEVSKLVRIILSLPVSRCTAERSSSGLRRLKTYLRSRMPQERSNAVAIMNIHKEEVTKLSIDELIDNFISRNAVRKSTFFCHHKSDYLNENYKFMINK